MPWLWIWAPTIVLKNRPLGMSSTAAISMSIGPTACPKLITGKAADGSYTRQRAALPGTKRIAGPGCNVTATTLALQPGIAEGLVESQDIVADLVVGYSGAGKNLKRTNLLAAEASAIRPAVFGGRQAPPHSGDPAELRARGRQECCGGGRLHARLHADSRPDVARHPRHRVRPNSRTKAKALTDAEIRARSGWTPMKVRISWWCCLRARCPPPPTSSDLTQPTCRSSSTINAGRLLAFAAIDNLNRGTAGQAVQSLNMALGPAGRRGPDQDRSGTVSVTFAQGFPPLAWQLAFHPSKARRTWPLVVNNGPARRGCRRVHLEPFLCGPCAVEPRKVVSDGHVKAVILNSGGANACTGEARIRAVRRHRWKRSPASSAPKPNDVAVCSTGLIGELLPFDNVLSGAEECI